MVQQFHFWECTQNNWKHRPKGTPAYLCCGSVIRNCQKLEAACVSISGWRDEQRVVYTYSGMLLSLKMEEKSHTYYNMGKFWRSYAEWNKPDTGGHILYDYTS